MESLGKFLRLGACAAIAVVVGGASLPSAMIGPGEWEVGKSLTERGARVCLSDPAVLMQWEHRRKSCSRVILSSSATQAEVQYQCAAGGFGTSRLRVLTPRSVTIDTQGISGGYPFAYAVHARRIGNCAGR